MDKDTIKIDLEQLSSEELLDIWNAYDLGKYKRETFPVIQEILNERGIDIPPQSLSDVAGGVQGDVQGDVQQDNESSIAAYFKFKILISSSLIRIIYFIGMIIITYAGYSVTVRGNLNSIAGISILIFGNLLWRIICEGSIIFFRIHDLLVSIDKKS